MLGSHGVHHSSMMIHMHVLCDDGDDDDDDVRQHLR